MEKTGQRGHVWGGNREKEGTIGVQTEQKTGRDEVETEQKRVGMGKQGKSGQGLGETEEKWYQDKMGQNWGNRSKERGMGVSEQKTGRNVGK